MARVWKAYGSFAVSPSWRAGQRPSRPTHPRDGRCPSRCGGGRGRGEGAGREDEGGSAGEVRAVSGAACAGRGVRDAEPVGRGVGAAAGEPGVRGAGDDERGVRLLGGAAGQLRRAGAGRGARERRRDRGGVRAAGVGGPRGRVRGGAGGLRGDGADGLRRRARRRVDRGRDGGFRGRPSTTSGWRWSGCGRRRRRRGGCRSC